MAWYDSYFGGNKGKGKDTSSSTSSSTSNSFGNTMVPDVSGYNATSNSSSDTSSNSSTDTSSGSTVINNKPANPYLYGGTTSEDLADVGFTGVGNFSPEDRQEESKKNPDYVPPSSGGTLTETGNDGTVTTTTNVLSDNPTVTTTTPDNGDEGNDNKNETDFFDDLFDDDTTELPDDAKKNATIEEKRALVLKFKAQSGYDQLPQSLKNEADKIIAKINAGEYFGSDFANMQGTTQTGNEILAGNNKSITDISEQDALNLFRIATQNKNASTAREAGFSATAEALLKSYVETLSPADKAAFQAEAKKIKDAKFTDPRDNVLNIYRDPALLKRLTGLSSLNENQLDYDQFINEAQRVRDSKSDNTTGQVNTFTSSQMGTDTTEQGENAGYGSAIGSTETLTGFVDTDGDGVDDRYQSGPNQPYEGPDRDPNQTTTPDPDVTTGATPNPNSFGNTALSGVYNLIPVKNRFTGQIEYIQAPVRNVTSGTRNFGSIYI